MWEIATNNGMNDKSLIMVLFPMWTYQQGRKLEDPSYLWHVTRGLKVFKRGFDTCAPYPVHFYFHYHQT